MPHRPTQFQSTVVKPYYKDNSSKPLQDAPENAPEDALEDTPEDALEDAPENTLKDTPEDALENAPEKNYDQCTPEGDYNPNTIVIDMPQPQCSKSRLKGL
jgi:hypothetical protein